MTDDARWMQAALALASLGLGRVWPNPSVGCILVREGRVVGRGRTADGGRPHAEVQALAQAGAQARGATAYVTLEPCAHHGETPPCAEALITAGVTRVVVAIRDPDPRVDGGGLDRLRDTGIEVREGVCADEATRMQAGFLSRVTLGRPLLTLKLATTLDGRIATASGESQWITGPEARHHVHGQRACHDAVMVGGGTARADDPRLTVRGFGPRPQPVRVVVSGSLDLPDDGSLVRSARASPVWVLCGEDAPAGRIADLSAAGVKVLPCPFDAGGSVDVIAGLQRLGEAGLTRVYCEGGGALGASLLRADLVDRLDCYTAGAAIGAEGIGAVGPMGLDRLQDAPRLALESARRLGADVLHRWTRPT